MAFLSLVLFCLACFAGDVVELEPVSANEYNCNQYVDVAACTTQPGAKAYCTWSGTCIDDPQLRVLAAGDDTDSGSCRNGIIVDSVSYGGRVVDLTAVLPADCVEAKGTGKICASDIKTTDAAYSGTFNYCVYAWLRDGVCPDSVCIKSSDTPTGQGRNQCLPTNVQQCTVLSTATECGLVPKCYWVSGKCYDDPCWATGPIVAPNTCIGLGVILPTDSPAVTKTNECKLFQPLVAEETEFCVHKSQSNPNICYFGTPGATYTTTPKAQTTILPNDFNVTYPTYRVGANPSTPSCSGTIGTGCEGNGNCSTVINTKGAFAGKYCSDGTHGSANILHVPFVLVLLILSALSVFDF